MTELGTYLIVGMLAGLLSGLLGIGGGVILVPSFLWMFEYQGFSPSLATHMASASSLAAMIITTLVSFYTHWRKGVRVGNLLYELLPGLLVGTVIGAVLAHHLHAHLLRIFFGLLVLGIAFSEYFHHEPKDQPPKRKALTVIGGGLGIGTVSGLLGVGGGTLMVPFLQHIQIPTRNAVGISSAGGLGIALVGTVTFILLGMHLKGLPPYTWGYIYGPAVLGVSIGSPIFAMLGAILSHRVSIIILKRIFSVFLIFVALRLLHY